MVESYVPSEQTEIACAGSADTLVRLWHCDASDSDTVSRYGGQEAACLQVLSCRSIFCTNTTPTIDSFLDLDLISRPRWQTCAVMLYSPMAICTSADTIHILLCSFTVLISQVYIPCIRPFFIRVTRKKSMAASSLERRVGLCSLQQGAPSLCTCGM